jgi:O-antigen ligase
MNTNFFRMTTIMTAALFFLVTGTFTSITVQGVYLVLFVIPLTYYSWKAKGRSFKLPASGWWLIGLAIVLFLSIITNLEAIERPFKNLSRIKYYLFAALGIFPVGVWLKTVSDRTKKRLLMWFVVAFAIAASWSLANVFMGEGRKALTDTMRYSYGTAYTLILMIGLLLNRKKFSAWYDTKWVITGIIFGLIGIMAINTRGAQGSFFLALPFVLWFYNKKWALILGLVFSLGGGFIGWNYFYGSDSASQIRILSNKNNSSDNIRRTQWESAFIAFKEKPVLGWGYGNFHSQVERIKNEYDLGAKHYVNQHAHNVLLEVAAGTGIIGLIFFLGFFFTWVWECWRYGGVIRAVMMPVFVALIFQAQFEVILDANNMAWLSFIYAVTKAWDKRFQIPFI